MSRFNHTESGDEVPEMDLGGSDQHTTKALFETVEEQLDIDFLKGRLFRMYRFLNSPASSTGAFYYQALLCIVFTGNVVLIMLETLDGPNHYKDNQQQKALFPALPTEDEYSTADLVINCLFTADFVLRFCLTLTILGYFWESNSAKAVAQHFFVDKLNLLDLISVLPFWITFLFLDPGSVRVSQEVESLLRLGQLMKVGRISRLLQTTPGYRSMVRAASNSLYPMSLPMFFFLVFNILFGVIVFALEPCMNYSTCSFNNFFDATFYSIVTMTTVGYGDQTPKIFTTRIVAAVIMIFGSLFLAMPLAIIGNEFEFAWKSFVAESQKQREEAKTETVRRWSTRKKRRKTRRTMLQQELSRRTSLVLPLPSTPHRKPSNKFESIEAVANRLRTITQPLMLKGQMVSAERFALVDVYSRVTNTLWTLRDLLEPAESGIGEDSSNANGARRKQLVSRASVVDGLSELSAKQSQLLVLVTDITMATKKFKAAARAVQAAHNINNESLFQGYRMDKALLFRHIQLLTRLYQPSEGEPSPTDPASSAIVGGAAVGSGVVRMSSSMSTRVAPLHETPIKEVDEEETSDSEPAASGDAKDEEEGGAGGFEQKEAARGEQVTSGGAVATADARNTPQTRMLAGETPTLFEVDPGRSSAAAAEEAAGNPKEPDTGADPAAASRSAALSPPHSPPPRTRQPVTPPLESSADSLNFISPTRLQPIAGRARLPALRQNDSLRVTSAGRVSADSSLISASPFPVTSDPLNSSMSSAGVLHESAAVNGDALEDDNAGGGEEAPKKTMDASDAQADEDNAQPGPEQRNTGTGDHLEKGLELADLPRRQQQQQQQAVEDSMVDSTGTFAIPHLRTQDTPELEDQPQGSPSVSDGPASANAAGSQGTPDGALTNSAPSTTPVTGSTWRRVWTQLGSSRVAAADVSPSHVPASHRGALFRVGTFRFGAGSSEDEKGGDVEHLGEEERAERELDAITQQFAGVDQQLASRLERVRQLVDQEHYREVLEMVRAVQSRHWRDRLWLLLDVPSSSAAAHSLQAFLMLCILFSTLLFFLQSVRGFQNLGVGSRSCEVVTELYCANKNDPSKDPGCFVQTTLDDDDPEKLDFFCDGPERRRGGCYGSPMEWGSRSSNMSCRNHTLPHIVRPFREQTDLPSVTVFSSRADRHQRHDVCFRPECNDDHDQTMDGNSLWLPAEIVLNSIFTLELLLRLLTARSLKEFTGDWLNWCDAISVAPFFYEVIAAMMQNEHISFDVEATDEQVLTFMRILKVTRIFKITRHFHGSIIILESFKQSWHKLMVPLGFLLLITTFFSIVIFEVERGHECFVGKDYDSNSACHSLPADAVHWKGRRVLVTSSTDGTEEAMLPEAFTGLWFSLVTMTSVGYGDVTTKTSLGMVLSAFLMVFGSAYVAMPLTIMGGTFFSTYKFIMQEEERFVQEFESLDDNGGQASDFLKKRIKHQAIRLLPSERPVFEKMRTLKNRVNVMSAVLGQRADESSSLSEDEVIQLRKYLDGVEPVHRQFGRLVRRIEEHLDAKKDESLVEGGASPWNT